MPRLTPRRAVWVAALAAALLYTPALRNRWALDDHAIVEDNPAAHSIAAALGAAFSPYWPSKNGFSAGLYRPLTTLSYAVDWAIAGDHPWWFHFTNLLLNALATGLVVLVALRWLGPPGALAAGLVFATHAVHVEAVANVVGRAEILTGIGILAAVLAARRYREALCPAYVPPLRDAERGPGGEGTPAAPERGSGGAGRWLAAVLLAVLLALGSKETGVMACVLIALDQALDEAALRRVGWNLYVAVAAVTVGWLFLWRAIAGALATGGAAVTLVGLSVGQRLATAIPVQLDVLRLLAWPARLASDYSPQTIPLRLTWTPIATLALVTSLALLALAWLVRRRAPAVTFGVLAAAATYLPTSNLLFTSGIVLAERTLYLAVLAPALAAGWLVMHLWETQYRSSVLAAAGAACVVLGARSAAREPFWRDTRTVIIDRVVGHPENAFAQYRLAEALLQSGDSGRALAQYLTAYELYGGYALFPELASQVALGLGRPRLAVDAGRQAFAIAPADPNIAGSLVQLFLTLHEPDSALAVAREGLRRNPLNPQMLAMYQRTLERVGGPRRAVQLARARLDGVGGRFVSASAIIDSVGFNHLAAIEPAECFDLQQSLPMLRLLAAADTIAAQHLAERCLHAVSTLQR